MQKSKEEIFASAYQIDCMVRMYELLVEISQKLEVIQMQKCMEISSLLAFLYERWLKTKDTQTTELEEIIQEVLQGMKSEVA